MSNKISTGKGELKPVRRGDDVFDLMRREIDTVFDRFLGGSPMWPSLAVGGAASRQALIQAPRMDISETGEAYVMEAELPGVDQKDVTVTLQNGILTLRGEKKQEREEKTDNYHLSERSFGSFERSIRLPDTADDGKVDARFENGVLKISVAKRAEAIKPERRIEIKAG